MNMEISPVLLCGGSGTRLWPLSRADVPKQLQALAHEETMLQATALRASGTVGRLNFRNPVVVSGDAHQYLVTEQLLHVRIQPEIVILEPQGRNTAPAVALAALYHVGRGNPDTLMLVMPSDHIIGNEVAFHNAVLSAAPSAMAGRLVTFGIEPTEAATGYGYIEAEKAVAGQTVRSVRRFVEKPDAETAKTYVASGLLWNAGIFLMKASAFLAALEQHAPDIAVGVTSAMAQSEQDGLFLRPHANSFAAIPSISIDYAVMERSGMVSVIPVDMGWSDVGSWDALWKVTAPDADGNVVRGAGALVNCRDSLVRNDGGPYVAALGLENMVVVATGDAILIAPRSRAEDIRKVVDRIEEQGLELTRTSHEVRRPWGSYRSLGHGEGWQVKRIAVKPGGRLSLQRHAQRAETWVVATGTADVIVDNEVRRLSCGESIFVPKTAVHRLENPGPGPLEIIEVQQGAYLGEDDIERLADIYGRSSSATKS
ncbi:MAG: mannose-1-phosphate guanylyltransferase/mannose-6-phosphate isomerase [Sphingomonas sp.]|nr:MAG: mannose-1-phosphate guanylyltransferase/mannose-6-phosphate isomerase [Sphingomonas sp.]